MALKWNDNRYATGISVVDAQHKEMFDHIDQLLKASEVEDRKEELAGMLEFLGGYVVEHFRFEEEVMEQRSCASLEENRQDHERLLNELEEVKAWFDREGDIQSLRERVMGMVVQWLEAHIAGVDIKLRETAS